MSKFTAENQLLGPLIAWLRSNRRLGAGATVIDELAWFGRKIDLVTLTRSYRLTAYELKLNGFRRAVEQAAYNRLAFDRAYVVTVARPMPQSLELAEDAGVGVILIDETRALEIISAPLSSTLPKLRRKLLGAIRETPTDVRDSVFSLP